MANIVFARTDDPNSKAIKDGQLVFDTSGNGKMYLDNGTERLEMGGSMSVDSVLNAESTNPIQNKAVAGVMLKTLDEVGAVTKAGFIPDALTVKQLNSNLDGKVDSLSGEYSDAESTTYTSLSVEGVGYDEENGQLLLKVEGADTVIPFKSGFEGICTVVDGHKSWSDSSDRYDWQKTFTYTATEDCFIIINSFGHGNSQSINTTSVSNGAKIINSSVDYKSYMTTYYCYVYCPKGSTVSHYFYCLNYSHGGWCYLSKLN